jgi:hypothetical protein
VLVSRPYADAYFPDGKAVGASITVLGAGGVPTGVVTVAGVVDDFHLRNLEQAAERVVFIDPRQALAVPRPSDRDFLTIGVSSIAFAARTTGDPTSIISDLRAIARDIDPRLAIDAAMPMERIVSGLPTRPRFYAAILTTFGAIAGFIAVIGLYGVLSYVVSQRTKELGIRMALGAQRGRAPASVAPGWLVVGIRRLWHRGRRSAALPLGHALRLALDPWSTRSPRWRSLRLRCSRYMCRRDARPRSIRSRPCGMSDMASLLLGR